MIPDALKSVVLSVGQPCGIPVGSVVYPGIISKMSNVKTVCLMSYSLQRRDSDFWGKEWKYVLYGE